MRLGKTTVSMVVLIYWLILIAGVVIAILAHSESFLWWRMVTLTSLTPPLTTGLLLLGIWAFSSRLRAWRDRAFFRRRLYFDRVAIVIIANWLVNSATLVAMILVQPQLDRSLWWGIAGAMTGAISIATGLFLLLVWLLLSSSPVADRFQSFATKRIWWPIEHYFWVRSRRKAYRLEQLEKLNEEERLRRRMFRADYHLSNLGIVFAVSLVVIAVAGWMLPELAPGFFSGPFLPATVSFLLGASAVVYLARKMLNFASYKTQEEAENCQEGEEV